MADWPNIEKPSRIVEKTKKVVNRSPSEAGYTATSSKWTSAKSSFSLTWDAILSSSKATLKAFFDTNQGVTFTWVHPELGTSYTCIFSEDFLEFTQQCVYQLVNGDPAVLWAVTVNIEEP